MGRGSSKVSAGGGGAMQQEFPEAFAPGKDYEAVNGVDHDARTVSRMTQSEWDDYVSQFGADISSTDQYALDKDWQGVDSQGNDILYGYLRTTNAMALNKKLYDNDGKSPDEIFTKNTTRDRRDLDTVKTLDRLIDSHSTPADGTYYRFCNPKSLQKSYGLSDQQMSLILDAPNMTPRELKSLNTMLKGFSSSNPGFSSYSANRSLNAFKNPTKKQSTGYVIERRMGAKKGTKAFAAKSNAQESEVIFGRNFGTNFSHITVEGNHIVIHEYH